MSDRPFALRNGVDAAVRDDRGLQLTRQIARVVIPSLAAASLALFGFPTRTTERFAWTIGGWPWTVAPLTARVLAGWFALLDVVDVTVVLDGPWSAGRVVVLSQLLGFTLILPGVVRGWDTFDTSNALTWGIVAGMDLYLGAILLLYLGVDRR